MNVERLNIPVFMTMSHRVGMLNNIHPININCMYYYCCIVLIASAIVHNVGVIGWPELTEWPGGVNSPTMDVIGAKLTYGLTNFSYKFLNITFYNGSEQIANLTHFADGYKVVITCEYCESTTIQLYIPAEGRYRMCYNFTYDVQWTGQSNFPPGYEVPNCTQYTQAIPSKYLYNCMLFYFTFSIYLPLQPHIHSY